MLSAQALHPFGRVREVNQSLIYVKGDNTLKNLVKLRLGLVTTAQDFETFQLLLVLV